MTGALIYGLAGVAVFCLGFYALIAARHVLRRILALNVLGVGVYMLLVSLAARSDPIDPIPHAMVITGIVVAVSATALALALLRRMHAEGGSGRLPEDRR